MKEKIEEYLSGSINKPKIDKTRVDFLKEWFNSLLTVRRLILLIVALFGAKYALDFFVVKLSLPVIFQKGLGFILFPLIVVAIIIFVARTIGLILTFLFPDIKGRDFFINNGVITFLRENGGKDEYKLSEVKNFILTYNFRGLLIRTIRGAKTYQLKFEPKEMEMKLDVIPDFHKQITSIQSREGNIRTVWYGNPSFGAENKSFTATNEGFKNYDKKPLGHKRIGHRHKFLAIAIGLLPFLVGLSFVGIGIYNSLFRIIPIYKTTFINGITVTLPEDAYQKIEGNIMQIVVEKNSEFGSYSGEIHSERGDYYFNGYTHQRTTGSNYILAGWTEIPRARQFTLKMSPETKNAFTLTINYIR